MLYDCIQVTAQSGNFTLEVRVYTYWNPTHGALGAGGHCCDNPGVLPVDYSSCTDHCDTYLVFCLRDFDALTLGPFRETIDLTDCPRSNREQTGVLAENNDNLTFTLGQPFPKSPNHSVVPNPVQLHGSNWNVSVSLKCMQYI